MTFRFEGLEIWHMAREFTSTVYGLTARFPRHEDYGLRSQMNRAVNSAALNVAEGAGKNSARESNANARLELTKTVSQMAEDDYINSVAGRQTFSCSRPGFSPPRTLASRIIHPGRWMRRGIFLRTSAGMLQT